MPVTVATDQAALDAAAAPAQVTLDAPGGGGRHSGGELGAAIGGSIAGATAAKTN